MLVFAPDRLNYILFILIFYVAYWEKQDQEEEVVDVQKRGYDPSLPAVLIEKHNVMSF